MKKRLFPVALMACTVILSACSKNDGNDTSKSQADKFEDYSMTTEWINYTVAASSELLDDCIALWASWNGPTGIPDEDWERIGRDFFTKNTMVGSNGYADYMRTAEAGNRAFTSGVDAIRTILVDGMANIANEVGTSKIGTPNALAKQGNTAAAVLQVESWYSWHSREDYSNNIISIYNALTGTRGEQVVSNNQLDLTQMNAAAHSIYSVVSGVNTTMADEVMEAVKTAHDAILAIPQPFRNHINSTEALEAQRACADLFEALTNLKGYIDRTGEINTDEVLDPVVSTYVDVVVLPTYKDLKDKNQLLYNAVYAFSEAPSDAAFEDICDAWLVAREPWETSEAFLFGPVADQGLDPNMDSWPLDKDAIVNVLETADWGAMEWTGDFTEDGANAESIANAQAVRGFHTLEFLAFRNGMARTLNDQLDPNDPEDYVYSEANKQNWGDYMMAAVTLLVKDSDDLYSYWNDSYKGGDSYAKRFKEHRLTD